MVCFFHALLAFFYASDVIIAHLHDDVTRAKSSGSCSQIRGMF